MTWKRNSNRQLQFELFAHWSVKHSVHNRAVKVDHWSSGMFFRNRTIWIEKLELCSRMFIDSASGKKNTIRVWRFEESGVFRIESDLSKSHFRNKPTLIENEFSKLLNNRETKWNEDRSFISSLTTKTLYRHGTILECCPQQLHL